MQLRSQPSLFAAGVVLQAVGLAVWWEWFNILAFGSGGWPWGVFKAVALSGLLSAWSFILAWFLEKKFGWDPETYRFQDMLAGMPLALLPAVIPLAPWVVSAVKPFSLTLLGFTWMPWWYGQGLVLSAGAKAVLLISGLFIMAAALAKVGLLLRRLLATEPEQVSAGKLFAVGLVIYLLILSWPACMLAPQAGERPHLLVMQSLAYNATLDVSGVLERGDFRSWYPLPAVEFAGRTDGIGQLFSAVAPGMPLLFITFFLLQGRWLMAVLSMLFAAGAAAQLYGLGRDLGRPEPACRRVWALALLTLPLALYGYLQYEVAAGAFFLLWGLRLAWREAQTPASASAVGLVAGLMLLGGIRFFLPAGVLLLLLAWRLASRRNQAVWLIALLVAAIPGIFAGWFASAIYGFLLAHPIYHLQWPWQSGGLQNLLGLLTDRFAGVLWTAPVWVLGLAGLAAWWSKGTRMLVVVVGILLIHAVVTAMSFPDPWAEGAAFHRFVAPVMPLLGLGLLWFWEPAALAPAWLRLRNWLCGWSLAAAAALAVMPPLAWESSRLRLAEILPPWGAVYNLLPSYAPRVQRWELLVSLVIAAAAVGLAWTAFRALAKKA